MAAVLQVNLRYIMEVRVKIKLLPFALDTAEAAT
jgi:hypothetical protein